jgi:hypothetical protein
MAQSVFKIGNEGPQAFRRGRVRNLLQQPARLLKLPLKVGSGFVAITHRATPVLLDDGAAKLFSSILLRRRLKFTCDPARVG